MIRDKGLAIAAALLLFAGAQRLTADGAQHRPHLRRRPRLRRRRLPTARSAVKTPNIDRLAQGGPALHRRPLRRGDLHAVALRAADRRICLAQAGHRRPARRRGADHRARPDRRCRRCCRAAGYATGVVGKWHLGLGPSGGPDWNGEIKPGPLDIGFDYAFIMAATGDRVPCVYVEDHRVVGLDPADPITVSYAEPIGDGPTGKGNPELLKMQPSHGHDQTIVNGISRIGYMTGGKAALWKDEDMADVFTRKAVGFIEQQQGASRSSSTSPRTTSTCRACRTRGSPARRRWGRAATRSSSSTGRSARFSTRSTG